MASGSSQDINVLIVARNKAHADSLASLLQPFRSARVVGSLTDSTHAVEEARARSAQIALVETSTMPDRGLDVAKALIRDIGLKVILVSDETGAGQIQQAMRLGVRDFLIEPASEELIESIRICAELKVDAGGVPPPPVASRGRIVSVTSARGGVGKSLVAANLAILLARRYPEKVLLADLSLQYGSADSWLGYKGVSKTIRSLSGVLTELRRDTLDQVLHSYDSNLRILFAPTETTESDEFDARSIESLLVFLKSAFPICILDTAPHFDDTLKTAVRESDIVLVVVTPEFSCIRDTAKFLKGYKDLRYPMDRLRLVVNRGTRQDDLKDADIAKQLGCEVVASLPESLPVVRHAINSFAPLVSFPRDPIVPALVKLARTLEPLITSRSLEAASPAPARVRR